MGGYAFHFIISFSSLFLPTINLVSSSNLKCLPIFRRSISFIVGFFVCENKSLALIPNCGSVNKQPPPAFGGFSIPYFYAISNWFLLVLPLIIPRFSLLIKPSFSGSVSGNNAADNGLTIFPTKSDSFSIVFNAGAC